MTINSLYSVLIGCLAQSDVYGQAFSYIATSLSSYLNSNLTILGVYTGTLNGSPSALNGVHSFSVTANINASALQYAAPTSNDFGLTSELNLQPLSSISQDVLITLSAPVFMGAAINLLFSAEDTFNASWMTVSTAIYNGIVSSLPSVSPCPAIGTDGSVGTFTFTNQN